MRSVKGSGTPGRSAIALAVATAIAACSLPAMAQNASAPADAGLEEVVISAQFREEKLQETPLAITALSGDTLLERNVTDVSQLQNVAPSVSLDRTGSAFGPSISAFIRGVGQGDFNYNYEPGVGIYVDDVYHATLMGSLFQLVDLERVEVLRGPQGTLFGKNSIGGAIRLISTKPKGDGSGYVEATYGRFNRKELRAMIDIPIIEDRLFMRASAMSQNYEGFVKRLDYACVDPTLGASSGYTVNTAAPRLINAQGLGRSSSCVVGTEGGADVQGARFALRFLATDTFEVNFEADWSRDNSEAAPTVLVSTYAGPSPTNPTTAPGAPALNADASAGPIGATQQGYLANYGVYYDNRFITGDHRSNYSTFYDLQNDITTPAVNGIDSWGGALTLDWDIAEKVHLKSVTGYRGYSGAWSDDQDNSPLPLAWVYNTVDHHAFSQEIQVTGQLLDDKLDWAAGAFYFDGYNENGGHVNLNILGLDFTQADPSNVEDKAGFVQVSYHFTEQLTATAGGRFTTEDKDYTFNHQFIEGVTGQSGYDRWDYKAGVDYKWTADLMTYAQVSTGFKGGGLNPRPFAANQVVAFGPETLTSYEIGAKSQWFDRRLTANIAAFLGKYEDLQLSSGRPDANGIPFTGPTNVGREDIRGFELEVEATPIRDLSINFALSLTDSEYKDLGVAIGCNGLPSGVTPIPAGAGVSNANCVLGGPLLSDTPGGPPWRGNIGVQYRIHFAGGSSVTPRLDYNFRDHAPYGNSNEAFTDTRLSPLQLLNGRVTWLSSGGDWSVAGYGTNLLNRDYIVNYFDLRAFGEAQAAAQPGRPREWGITLRKSFN